MIRIPALMWVVLVVGSDIRILDEDRVVYVGALSKQAPLVVLGAEHQYRLKLCGH